MELFQRMGLALAVGLLIGIERGWHERTVGEGRRIAGIRTFGLIGLLGGLWALLSKELGAVLLGFAFLAFGAIMIIAHVIDARVDRDYGITTVVAGLVTFALGSLSVLGYEIIAAACAVVTATLLSLKPVLHRWLKSLEERELYATLKLMLISVVLLPVLPDKGYGPWQALNPYQIWWMVVLIAGISFVGYFAMKIAGTRQGIMLTGFFGGMVSSTAVALNFARLCRQTGLARLLSAGVLVASGTMFPRILVEVAIVNPNLLLPLTPSVILMSLAAYGISAMFIRMEPAGTEPGECPVSNPFQILPALQFGILLAAVILLSELFRAWLGETGVYLLAAASGVADVDAITLSMARMARGDLPPVVAARAIILAAMMNTVVKGMMVSLIAGRRMTLMVSLSFLVLLLLGGLGLYLI